MDQPMERENLGRLLKMFKVRDPCVIFNELHLNTAIDTVHYSENQQAVAELITL